MVLPLLTGRCTTHRKIANEVYEFTLAMPEGFSFRAGQFILFEAPLVENPEDIQPRAFSIASSPEEKELLFVAKLKPGGRASRWISEVLREGHDVKFRGPFGNLLLDEETDKPYIFLSTCTGVAPFRSQIVHALKRGDTRKMDLIFCVRDEGRVFWEKEFRSLEKAHRNFHFHIGLSQPSQEWKGPRGRIQAIVPGIVPDLAERSIYICGNPDMVKEMKELCVSKGILKQNLHAEGYI